MNYVNREAAEALKDAGFDVETIAYYVGFFSKNEDVRFYSKLDNHNQYDDISAPDFLTAADWISEKSDGDISVLFSDWYSVVYLSKLSHHIQEKDCRNKAILFALTELKKLKAEETKQS
jgi:hypothetical protein